MIGDRQMAFAKKFTVYTEFKKITGLQPGAIVRVSGAKAGSITQILPPDTPSEKFRVKLEITEDLHQLVRTDSLATIETEGLVGGSYLGIGTGTDAAPPVAPNATIAGKEPFDIADLMQQMGDTIKKVNDTIDDMKGDVQRAVVAIGDTVDNANALHHRRQRRLEADGGVRREDHQRRRADRRGHSQREGHDRQARERRRAVQPRHRDRQAGRRDRRRARRQVVENAKKTLEGFQSKDGPVQGMTASVKQTMDDARAAMAGLAENMDALKHNFLLRGFFNRRGYFDLAQMSPADYRQGALTKGSDRRVVRVWQRADVLFEPEPDHPENERLTEPGKAWVDAAIAPYLEHVASGIVIVEGYAQQGTRDEQYLRSRARASIVRDYLIGKFHLDPQATGAMPLSADSTGSPGKAPWDGVALAVILPKAALQRAGNRTTIPAPTNVAEQHRQPEHTITTASLLYPLRE